MVRDPLQIALSPIDDRGELLNKGEKDNGTSILNTSLEEDARTILTATSPVTNDLAPSDPVPKLLTPSHLSKLGTLSVRRKQT